MVRTRKRGGKKIQKGGMDILKHISNLFTSGEREELRNQGTGEDCMEKCKKQCQQESSTSTDETPQPPAPAAPAGPQIETDAPKDTDLSGGRRKKRRKRRKKTKKKKHKKHKRKTHRRKKKGKRRTKKR